MTVSIKVEDPQLLEFKLTRLADGLCHLERNFEIAWKSLKDETNCETPREVLDDLIEELVSSHFPPTRDGQKADAELQPYCNGCPHRPGYGDS